MRTAISLICLSCISMMGSELVAQVNSGVQFGNQNQNINRNQFDGGAVEIETEFLNDDRRSSINDQNGGTQQLRGGAAGFQQLFQGLANQQQQGNQRQGQSAKARIVRAPLRVGFSLNPPGIGEQIRPSVVQQSRVVLSSLPRFQNSNLQLNKNGSGYVLTGSVTTQSEKELAARVAKLQPGVKTVDNQIVVVAN